MTQPLDISNFGCIPDGKTDNIAAIRSIITSAKKQNQPVVVPAGVFAYGDIFDLDGVELYGLAGAVLYALNPERSAIFLKGSGASLSMIRLGGVQPKARGNTRESCRVVALDATSFQMVSITVDTCAGAALRADRSSNGVIRGNYVADSLADSIHLTAMSNHIDVISNVIDRSGDDGVACVSYQGDGGMVSSITARGNVIHDNKGGRCMSIVGGKDILYENNFMSNNLKAAGMYFAQENAYKTFGVHRAMARRNTILNCGNPAIGHSALMIFSDGFEANDNVTFQRNLIQQTGLIDGVRVFGLNKTVLIDQNVVSTAGRAYNVTQSPEVIVNLYSNGAVGVP